MTSLLRKPLARLVAFCLLLLVAMNPPPHRVPPSPLVVEYGSPEVKWDELATRLEQLQDFYRWASQQPPPTTRPKTTPRPSGFSGSDVWAALAQCESGGTNASTGNGFYGYFQFVPSTWHSLGYGGLPTDFDYETQKAAAMQLQARSGWGQWPACARKLGLA